MGAYEIQKQYDWKIKDVPVDAQVAGEFFEKLEKENGSITPELVLEKSRDEGAVLHSCFEWDDSIAAEKYRVVQAGHLIRNITVVVQKSADEDTVAPTEVKVRALVNVSESVKGEYIAIETAMSNETSRRLILKNALTELRTFQRKYSIYAELADVCKAIEDFAKTIADITTTPEDDN